LHAFDPGAVVGTTRGGIDNIDYVDGHPGLVTHPRPTVVSHGAPVLISGWTVDPATNSSPAGVIVLVDRTRPLDARIGIARGDIMAEHGTDEFVGFQLGVDTTDLDSGSHELRVYALCSDGFWYESAAAGFRLYHDVVPAKDGLKRPLRMAFDGRIDLESGRHLSRDEPVPANHSVLFQGWTYDKRIGRGAVRIAAVDETGRYWSGPSDVERPDVAGATLSGDSRLGFEVIVPAAVFGRGRHRLDIVGFDGGGHRYSNALDVTLNVISEKLPFPLTARRSDRQPRFAARIRVLRERRDDDPNKRTRERVGDDDREVTVATFDLPATTTIRVEPTCEIRVEGWVLDADSNAADDVYLEVLPVWTVVPPQRLSADCGWLRSPHRTPIGGGIDGSHFTATVSADVIRGGPCEFAIVVVAPDRCSYTRVPIATVIVDGLASRLSY
jgi:hypothetical protein